MAAGRAEPLPAGAAGRGLGAEGAADTGTANSSAAAEGLGMRRYLPGGGQPPWLCSYTKSRN